MRRSILFLLALLLALPLTACSSGACGPATEPVLELKSPIWFQSRPIIQPSGYQMQVQGAPAYAAVPQYVAVPQYAAPAAGACVPAAGYTPGYQYAAPPVAGPAAGCR